MTARAFWTVAAGQGELRAAALSGEGLELRMLATGISRGTEALVFAGRVPESQYAAMRAPLMEGAFPFPVKYGYSAVGLAADGRRMFALAPHQDRIRVPSHLAVPVPDAVPTRRAVLGANMETALNIAWDACALPGERIMVIGAGVVGLLAASLLARLPGAVVTLVDLDPARAAFAARFGCAFATPDTAPAEQELIVHATGRAEGLRLALRCAAFEARIVEASWFGTDAVTLPLGEAFHARRLSILSTQVGAVAGPMRGRRTHAERLSLALSLLADDRYDALLDGPTRFEDLPARMPAILGAPGPLCHVVTYE